MVLSPVRHMVNSVSCCCITKLNNGRKQQRWIKLYILKTNRKYCSNTTKIALPKPQRARMLTRWNSACRKDEVISSITWLWIGDLCSLSRFKWAHGAHRFTGCTPLPTLDDGYKDHPVHTSPLFRKNCAIQIVYSEAVHVYGLTHHRIQVKVQLALSLDKQTLPAIQGYYVILWIL